MANGQMLGTQPVEILQIDTVNSGGLFEGLRLSPGEKYTCQTVLRDMFSACCQEADGTLGFWAGDGGHAFFPVQQQTGNSIKAATIFLSRLRLLAEKTATTIGNNVSPEQVLRRFRITGHFGIVHFGAGETSTSTASGRAAQYDHFIKYEREWAPHPDEIYITDQLYEQLGLTQKSAFEQVSLPQKHGTLETVLYRMMVRQSDHEIRDKILGEDFDHRNMTAGEWNYLIRHLRSQKMNVSARNRITVGLMEAAADNPVLNRETVAILSLRALFNYLTAMWKPSSFSLALWRPRYTNGVVDRLQVESVWPPRRAGRVVDIKASQYQVVRAWLSENAVITPSIDAARVKGTWVDFEPMDAEPGMLMQSSIQMPIYRNVEVGQGMGTYRKQLRAVLSVNADKPDFFAQQLVDHWLEDFVGFLANLSLSEHLPDAPLPPSVHLP